MGTWEGLFEVVVFLAWELLCSGKVKKSFNRKATVLNAVAVSKLNVTAAALGLF